MASYILTEVKTTVAGRDPAMGVKNNSADGGGGGGTFFQQGLTFYGKDLPGSITFFYDAVI